MNLTQSQVAKQLGISVSTYTKYETASNEPDLKMLVKLADFYHLSVDYLLRGHDNFIREKVNKSIILSENEKALITQYRTLDDLSKGETAGAAYSAVRADESMKRRLLLWSSLLHLFHIIH